MRRHLEAADLLEIGVSIPVERVGEQPLDRVAAIAARRQTDRMDQRQQIGRASCRERVS
jgi:hypothetical protein